MKYYLKDGNWGSEKISFEEFVESFGLLDKNVAYLSFYSENENKKPKKIGPGEQVKHSKYQFFKVELKEING